jgi:DNA-binding MarR family transcriptional regulator
VANQFPAASPKRTSAKEQSRSLFATLAELNRVVHEPARLLILTVLANCESADFTFLENATGLTKGNLWVQLTRLEKASLIAIEKVPKKNRTITTLRILAEGRHQLKRYWGQMEEVRRAAVRHS